MKSGKIKQLLALVLSTAIIFGEATTAYATDSIELTEEITQETSQSSDDDASDASEEASSEEDASNEASSEASVENENVTDNEETTEESTDAASDENSTEGANDAASLEESVEIEVEPAEDVELPEGIMGMPEGYTLTSEEVELKKDLIAHDVLDNFDELAEGYDYTTNEVLCLTDSQEHAEQVAAAYSGELESFEDGLAIIDLSNSPLSVEEAFTYGLDSELGLPAVEPNYVRHTVEPVAVEVAPTAALLGASGNSSEYQTWEDLYKSLGANADPMLSPSHAMYQWHLQAINAYAAWAVTKGNTNVTVAVIDTGVASHEDLANVTQSNVTGGTPTNSHGTHVAGIIAAKQGNKLGGSGIAPGVKILAINASSKDATTGAVGFEDADVVKAINNAISGKANIINMSLGGIAYSATIAAAIEKAYQNNITVVASMGNSSGSTKSYPAALPHVIAVAATSFDGKLTNFSSIGSWADIAAPGEDIYSTSTVSAKYQVMSGTSQASPIIAGACALYMSAFGKVSPDEMESVLKKSVTRTSDRYAGAGIIDLAKLFNGETTAPIINIDGVRNGVSGEYFTYNQKVAGTATISIIAAGYEGVAANNSKTKLIYTTDGTVPKYQSGEIVNGTLYSKAITVSTLNSQADANGLVTIKAIAVTGMGVVSGCTSLTIDVKNSTDTLFSSFNVPAKVVAGKSVIMTATTTTGEKVSWAITNRTGLAGARLATGGKLTTKAGETGTLEVTCTTATTKATKKATIKVVSDISTISTLKLSDTAISMNFDSAKTLAEQEKKTIKIATLTDAKGNDLSAAGLSFRWTSTNTKVVEVKAATNAANVTIVGAGSAKITCEALDGSGKKAVVSVTVVGDKAVSAVALDKTAVNLYVGSKTLASTAKLSATMTLKSGEAGKAAPLWTSSNVKVATVDNSGNVKAIGKGTAKITATSRDGSGKKAVATVTVIKTVSEIKVTGQKYMARGTSASYKAASVLPADASNKKVTWEIAGATPEQGVIIANGKVTVAKDATAKSFNVKAVAADGSGISGQYTVTVTDAKTVGISISATDSNKNHVCHKVNEKNGVLLSAQLFSVNSTSYSFDESSLAVAATITGSANEVSWSSSNEKVATVSGSNTKATVHGVSAGTATITCMAQDGSGKKASFKVTVITPVSDINVKVNGVNIEYVGFGKSVALSAVIGNAYGKPSNSKVTWDYTVCQTTSAVTFEQGAITELSAAANAAIKSDKKMFSMSGGRVKVIPSNYTKYNDLLTKYRNAGYVAADKMLVVKATAAAVDGSGVVGEKYLYPLKGSDKFSFLRYDSNYKLAFRPVSTVTIDSRYVKENTYYSVYAYNVSTKIVGFWKYYDYLPPFQIDYFANAPLLNYYVTSSNDKVATASLDYAVVTHQDKYTWYGIDVQVVPHAKGTTKITLTAQDGSNIKNSFTVKVK